MASKEPTPFQRIFSSSELLKGTPLNACLDLAGSTVLLVFALIIISLITELLVSGGQLKIPANSGHRLSEILGDEVMTELSHAPTNALGEIEFTNSGILPYVWKSRERYFGPVVSQAYRRFSPLRANRSALLTLVAVMAAFGYLRSMLESHARMLLQRTGLSIGTRLRQAIHRQTLRLGPSDLEGSVCQQALQLFTTEIDRVSTGVFHWALRMGRDPVRIAALTVLAFGVDPILAGVCLVPIAGCWYFAHRETLRINQVRSLSEVNSNKELRLLAESLHRTRLVRGYAMEAFEQEQFDRSLERFQQNLSQGLTAQAWSRRSIRVLVAACLAFVVFFVGSKVVAVNSEFPFSSAVLLLSAFAATWFPLQSLARLRQEHEPVEEAARVIQTYLNQIPEVGQAVGAKFLQPLSKLISFENVSYTTPGNKQLLAGLKLKIPAGRQIAIVATDPLEGQAIAYLLPRFIEPQSGKIQIDGEDIAWVTLESLRAETVYVGGKTPYLTGSIRDNISGGNSNFGLPEITEAAKISHAHNFISKLPQGYETIIGEHGEMLDPGQCFRLSIARAILRKPAIMIIEEPEEALDEDTKTLVDDAYKRIAINRTLIFLPRRLSTLKKVDEIALIHKGRMVAIGPRERLKQSAVLYRHWEYIHFNELRHEFESE
ncbi:MAG: ABC transporter ATP-binding protein [Planctomycetes bacterium]|nr:ABC transporter ATP-binding protein [Planctomycetota bacterium]